jgi:hypothetical protein
MRHIDVSVKHITTIFKIKEQVKQETGISQYFFIASGVGLSPLYCGYFWPIVPAPDDR